MLSLLYRFSGRGRFRLDLLRLESGDLDGSGRALEEALAAGLALFIVYVCDIVLHGDGVELADLGALATSDAGGLAGLAGHGALVLVYAGYIDAAAVLWCGSGVADLDHVLRAGLGAGAASCALGGIHYGKSRGRVHRDGSELAGGHAVAAAEASERATGVPAVEGSLDLAGCIAVISIGLRTVLTCSVAAYDSHHRGFLLHLIAEDGRNFLHHFISSDRAVIVVKVRSLHRCIGKCTAAGESAASTIRTRHHLLHLVDARVLLDLELLRDEEEDEGQQQSED